MFTRFKRSSSVMFLDPMGKESITYEKGKRIAIILSPSLYWVQKLSLPIKYVREVKKLLPSIFEDILPEGYYSYSAYKIKDDFFVFAYEDKKILTLIQEKGIAISDVGSIHFTQSEFDDLETPIKINEQQVMYLKNALVGVAPIQWFSEYETLDIAKKELSKQSIKLQQYGHIVKNSSLYKIAGLLLALIMLLVGESIISSNKIANISEAKEELFQKYKLKSTMFQNKSLQNKYKTIYTKQSKLREYIAYFLSMHLAPNQDITLIDYKNSTFTVTISGVRRGNESKIENFLHTKKVKYKKSFHAEIMKLEMKI